MPRLTKRERKIFEKMKKQKGKSPLSRQRLGEFVIWAIILMVLIVGGAWAWKELSKPLPGQSLPSLGNEHIDSIDTPHEPYNSTPPTSGPHMGGLADWGVHQDSVPEELFVHNMEDGGVIVHYNCEIGSSDQVTCDKLKEDLARVVEDYDHVLMHPYSKIDTRIALTAWERLDKFNEYDEKRIREFINAFEGIDHHVK